MKRPARCAPRRAATSSARGTARANVSFALTPDAEGTLVKVETDVQLAGSIAQYARGGLIESPARVLMNQFARNLGAELGGGLAEAPKSGDASVAAAAAAPAPEFSPDSPVAGDHSTASPAESPSSTPSGRLSSPAAREISAISLVFQGLSHALRRWLRGLFNRGSGA